jgi:ribosomal protein S7
MEQRKEIKINYLNYKTVLGFFIKSGNKLSARKIVDTALLKLSITLNLPVVFLLNRVFTKFNHIVEVKKIKNKRRAHFVPFPISQKRNNYLTMKWILYAIKEDKRRVSTWLKLYSELLKIYRGNKSKSLIKSNLNRKLSLESRSNMHYR